MIQLEVTASLWGLTRRPLLLLRPFRATSMDPSLPQGVALGWSITPLRGSVSSPILREGSKTGFLAPSAAARTRLSVDAEAIRP